MEEKKINSLVHLKNKSKGMDGQECQMLWGVGVAESDW
jgi:hypothetical protein